MNNLRILDTDHLSLLQRGNFLIRQQLTMFNPEVIAITIITATEQLRGRLNIINRCESANELVLAYARLEDTLEDINSLNVLQFTEAAGNIYTELGVAEKVFP